MSLTKVFQHYILSFFVSDPTENWREAIELELTFDFFKGTLNHITFNDPIHKLVVFGKPSNKNPHRFDIYEWKWKGQRVQADQGRVDLFEFVFRDWQEKWKQYNSAKIKAIKEKTIELSETNTKSEIRDFFGQPTSEFSMDEVPSLLVYHYPKLCVEFQFGLDEKLQIVQIYAPADELFRTADALAHSSFPIAD